MNAFNRDSLKNCRDIPLCDSREKAEGKIKTINKISFFKKLSALRKRPFSFVLYLLTLPLQF